MKFILKYQKKISLFLLVLMFSQLITPNICYALTSGPSQPEMKGFEPISSSDMVDLFSGDFSYNIPLMDVGGYPVNLAYHSGSGMDDEASWVGYGWSLNVGSVNRQLRGIPDDFNGTDKQQRKLNIKDHVTKGGRFSMTLDLLGFPTDKIAKKLKRKKLNLDLKVSIGIKVDNYRGLGMELGFNPGLSLSDYVAGGKTAEGKHKGEDSTTNKTPIPVSGGLTLSSQDGASANINADILLNKTGSEDKSESLSKSIGFAYNSRAGLTGMTMGTSFNASSIHKWEDQGKKMRADFSATSSSNSFISFNGNTYTPTIDHATKNLSFSFSFNLGPELWVAFPGAGVTGFYSRQTLSERQKFSPAFGYMYAEKGKDDPGALMDLNREKDIPYSSQVKYLPIPIPTYDLFSANSQDGSGQYRLYKGSSGIFFDQKTQNTSEDASVGIEVGAGTYFDVGADLYFQDLRTKTQKWIDRNKFLPKGDFQTTSADPLYEGSYFKRVGEPVPYDNDYISKIKNTGPVSVELPSKLSDVLKGAEASENLRTKSSLNGEQTSVLQRERREVRNTTFSYLTAREASRHGFDRTINDYNPDVLSFGACTDEGINAIQREGSYRRGHHISEITITGDDGKRSVYGIPVYNTYQEEVSFSVPEDLSQRQKGLISYNHLTDDSTINQNGLEHYYSKETTPPYATSYLLTAILSPDYVDLTKNGITDDDLGTAVKFNYSKLPSEFRWRTPYATSADVANYNEGFLSDSQDDKANYVFGRKEVWYLHSIESKTMVAQFVLQDRRDGLGVLDSRGEIDVANKLKALKEIRLYSKSDLKLNGNDPSKTIPIKVVHFVYDYSICTGLPNCILEDGVTHGGKLTLQTVYFTFGLNNKGSLNPYNFQYDLSAHNFYDYRQYDRWGNFKDADDNPGGLNNSEFPYVLQDSNTNQFASAWQLNKITLPSGGTINISYESDDYAYVQNKRASQMCMLNGVDQQGSPTNLVGADYIFVTLPFPIDTVASEDVRNKILRERYFEGITNLYFKFLLDLDAKGHKEFVPGYAEIDSATLVPGVNNVARIKLKKINKINPIARAGWQFLRTSLPKYAYPGSDNLTDDGTDLKKAIKALVTAFTNIKDLFYSFERRAKNKGYSNTVDLSKSWVRLCSPEWKKKGGGSRVKRIDISDDWATMSGTTGAKTAVYSQLYDYTTKNAKGDAISSGVASYEPSIGSDENPFHQPIRYKEKQFLALDNYYYIEEPFCESLFPAASVGYSKVTVKTIGTDDPESANRTGTVVSEFFTAKDYPVIVDNLALEQRKPATDNLFKLLSAVSYDMVGLSQGYSIELNDMHGKPRSVKVYNKSGQNISSVEYFYKTVNELAEKKQLANDVKIIDHTGTVSDGTIGMDVEMYTDMRQQTTENLGVSVKVSGGSGAFVFFPIPFFCPGIGINYDQRSYRAASTIKIINRFAIQYKVKKMENGSTINSENLLWDSETGNVLLTKTQNEFDDPVYSFAYPAHWIYDRMGQAFQNLGTILDNFSTGSNGTITNSSYNNLLVPGDELIDINSENKYWVINTSSQKRIINDQGFVQTISGITVKLIRSGRRNMANTAIATISSLIDPIVGDKLDVSRLTKVLDAKATVFSEEWNVPVGSNPNQTSFGQQCTDPACLATFFNAAICAQVPEQSRKGLFAVQTDQYDAGLAMKNFIAQGGKLMNGNCFYSFSNGLPADSMNYYLNHPRTTMIGCTRVAEVLAGDTATLGNCKLIFDYVNNSTQAMTDYNNCMDIKPAGYIPPCNGAGCSRDGFRIINDSCGFTVRKVRLVYSEGCYQDSTLYDLFRVHTICSPVTIGDCQSPVSGLINPYYKGVLGNWRPKSQFVFQVSRENIPGNTNIKGNTNIRKSGAYSLFNPFWLYENESAQKWIQINNGEMHSDTAYNDNKWIAANEVTYFNTKGLEIENKDALNRYSSALFGYLESMPIAVASNSRYREIAFDGFEDYGFDIDCSSGDTCNKGHFNFKKLLNGGTIDTTSLYSHSGKYSLKLNGSTTITKTVYLGDPISLYSIDNSGEYILQANELAKGFSPIPGKKYVLSFWVKDGNPRDPSTNVQATLNGVPLVSNLSKWPIVEGWKRIEAVFTVPSIATSFVLQLQSSGVSYFDDIRIHPFDGQMKSFAYDPSSQRLMAELDENNFATFYEYDDEGILIRVKKETERGIMTIKETRSSYRKH